MSINDIMMYTSAVSSIIPAILGAKDYKRFEPVFKLLYVYIMFGVISEVIGTSLALIFRNNLIYYNIYITLEAILIFIIYYKLFNSHYTRIILTLLGCLVVGYKIVATISAPLGLYSPEDFFRSGVSFIIITAALYLFYQILKTNDSQTSLYKSPVFWLNTAFLLYFMSNLFTFMIRNVMVYQMGKELNTVFITIHSFANVLMNLLLGFSFWLCRTEKR